MRWFAKNREGGFPRKLVHKLLNAKAILSPCFGFRVLVHCEIFE